MHQGPSMATWAGEDEGDRLRVLAECDAFGKAGMTVLDELVEIAAYVAAVPAAQINVIAEHRLWTVAATGAPAGVDAPRESALCDLAIGLDSALVIEDLQRDPKLASHPAIAAGTRFYAGFPLRSSEGRALGTLCVADVHARRLTGEQHSSLRALAAAAAAHLDARRHVSLARRATADLRALLDEAPDAFGSTDAAGRAVAWNARAERMLGWTRAEARGPEVALRSAEALFRGAFEHASIGIGLLTLHTGSWLEVNPALSRIVGRSEPELRGRPFCDLGHPDDLAPCEIGMRLVREGGLEVFQTEMRYPRDDGSVVWGDVSISLMRDATDAPTHLIAQIVDVTERIDTEEALRASERRLADAQSVGGVGSWEWDAARDELTWSDALGEIAGLPRAHHPRQIAGFLALVHEDDRSRLASMVERTGGDGITEAEYRLVRPDGEVRWVHGRVLRGSGADGGERLSGTVQDISDRRAAEHALRDAEERFRRSFEEAPIGIALVALDGRWLKVNDALCAITGYPKESLMELSFQDITHPDDVEADVEYSRQMLAGERSTYQMEKRYLRADGHSVSVQLNVSLARDDSGAPMYFISQVQDITERKRFERALEQAAREDHLTGLLNRRGFEQELEQHLARARRYRRGGALLVLDLDDFKTVNDTRGHLAGDQLLQWVARTLAKRLRRTDSIGRLGGDEFAAVLPEVGVEEAERAVASLTELLSAGAGSGVRVSIGLAMYDGWASMDELLADADREMYAVKADAREAAAARSGDAVAASPGATVAVGGG